MIVVVLNWGLSEDESVSWLGGGLLVGGMGGDWVVLLSLHHGLGWWSLLGWLSMCHLLRCRLLLGSSLLLGCILWLSSSWSSCSWGSSLIEGC